MSSQPYPDASTSTERPRSRGKRALIWALRRWWALAVIVLGGAITSQFSQVATTIFTAVLHGSTPSFAEVGASWTSNLQSINPVRAAIIFTAALVVTLAAFFAERFERAREAREHIAAQARERARQRDEVASIVQSFLDEKTGQGDATETETDDEDPAGAGTLRYVSLPPRPALVVGRDTEFGQIADALSKPETRALALRGMGGVGKSTLLAETLHRQAEGEAFPDGVVWLACQDLVGQDGLAQILEAADGALGRHAVARAHGLVAKEVAMRRALSGRRVLFGLDNVEQGLPLDRVLGALTPNTAQSRGAVVILTSRVSWAQESADLIEIDLDALSIDAGMRLLAVLLERARRPLTEAEQTEARAIVTAVGALPLAIELLAPRIARRAEPLAALALRLRQDGGTALRSVESAFAATYNQLDDQQQAAFSALGVFDGVAFAQAAALKVIGAILEQEDPDPQLLLDLSDLSLVRELPQPEGPPRYQLHPLMRQFARERLRDRGDVVVRHVTLVMARYYRAFAQQASARRRGYDPQMFEREYANIVGALTWAHQETASTEEPDAREGRVLVADIVNAIRYFIDDAGYWTEGIRFLSWGIAADQQEGNQQREIAFLVARAFITRQQGDLDGAERDYNAALALAQARKDRNSIAARLQNLGTTAAMRRQYDRARDLYAESLRMRREYGDRGGMSSVLRAMGTLAAEQGQLDEARQYLREALDLFNGRSRDVAFARTLRELAAVEIRDPQGDHVQARDLLDTALAIQRPRNQRYDIAQTLEWLGALDVLDGSPDQARAHWEEALSIYQHLGSNLAGNVRDRLARLDLARTPVGTR